MWLQQLLKQGIHTSGKSWKSGNVIRGHESHQNYGKSGKFLKIIYFSEKKFLTSLRFLENQY